MPSRIVSVELTGTNTKAVKAIDGVGTAASKAGAQTEKALGPAATAKIGAGFSKLDSQLSKFGVPFTGALGTMGAKMEATEGKAKNFGGSLAKVGQIAGAAALGGLIAVGAESLKLADSFDQAHSRLAVATKNVGESLAAESGHIREADEKLIGLGFTSTDTESSLAKLVPATHDVGKATQLMGLAADIARAKNIDLGSATDLLVKIEAGRLKGLAQFGIASKNARGENISNEEAIRRLTAAVQGQAQAYTGTYAGAVDVAKAKADELAVTLGQTEKEALVKVEKALLSGVEGFQKLNDATDGWLGKGAAIVAGGVVAFGAIGKLVDITKSAADAFGLLGASEVDAAATVDLAASSSDLAANFGTIATAADAAATAVSSSSASISDATTAASAAASAASAAATTRAVAAARVGVAEDAVAIASEKAAVAQQTLQSALASGLVTDAEKVAAADALTAAENSLAVATARAASASASASGATAAAGAGASVATGPVLLATAAFVGLGYALNHFFGGDNSTGKIKDLAVDLTRIGPAAKEAQESLAKIVGPQTTKLLAQYSDEILANADAQDKAKTKSLALLVATSENGGVFLKARDQVEAATKALDDYAKENGLAAAQSLELAAAERRYGDDLVAAAHGNSEAEGRLAADKKAVTDAARKQAAVQKQVNAAVDAGTSSVKDNGEATAKTAKEIKAEEAAAKALAASLTKLGDTAGPEFAKLAKAEHLSKDAIDSLTKEIGDFDKTFETSFDGAASAVQGFADKSQVSFDDFVKFQFNALVATQNWSANIATLAKDGIDKGFLKTLIDAGPKTAGLTQSIVDNVSKGSIGTINAMEAAADRAKKKTEANLNGLVYDANAFGNFISSLHPILHVGINVPNVHIAAVIGAGGGDIHGVSTGGSSFAFADGGYVPGPKGTAVPAIVHAGEYVVSNKMQDDAKAASRSLTTGALTSVAPSGVAVPNTVGVTFTKGRSGSSSTSKPVDSKGQAAAQELQRFVDTATNALPDAGTAISKFGDDIDNAMRVAKIRTKEAKEAAADYVKAQEKLREATEKANKALEKFTNDKAAASRVQGDEDALRNAEAKLKLDKAAGKDTTADERLVQAARDQLSKDKAAGNRLAADLEAVDKANKAQTKARAEYVLARGAKANTKTVAQQAAAAAKAASDPANFTKAVEAETNLIKLFEANEKTLVKAHDLRLAKAIAEVGPDDGSQLAAGFAGDLKKAAQAEKALAANEAAKIDFTKFASTSFKARGGQVDPHASYVVGEHGPEVFVPKSAGQIVPHGQSFTPLGQRSQPITLTIPIYIDGVWQGDKMVRVLQDQARIQGPLKIPISVP